MNKHTTKSKGNKIEKISNNSKRKTVAIKRTDMALELINDGVETNTKNGIKYSYIRIDAAKSKRFKKAEGVYITLETPIVAQGLISEYRHLISGLGGCIRELMPNAKSVLVVGLGNPSLTADALGNNVFKNLMVTRHLSLGTKVSLSAICPNVMGATGIESFDVIKGVVDRIKPDLVIAVDSLASATVGRIGTAFQICSSGITPGSGVANHRIRLDKASLGVEVISIGVPLVVYATTIIAEAAGEQALERIDNDMIGLIVTPKDIDMLVCECGKVIANAINSTFVPF